MRHALALLSVTLVTASIPSSVHAQPSGAQADVLFARGRQLMDAGKLAEACAAFEASNKLEPSTATVILLATCREKNGQLASAWGLLLQAERELRGVVDPNGVKLRESVKDRAAALAPRLSKLTIVVAPANQVAQLEILRDNDRVEPGAWNQALPIDGGTYKVSARAPERREWTTTVTLRAEGDVQVVEVPTLAAPVVTPPPSVSRVAPATPVPAAPAPSPAHSFVLPIAVGAGAVLLGGGALAVHLSANGIYDDATAAGDPTVQYDRWQRANGRRHLAQGLGLGALAAAGVAAYLFVRAGRDEVVVTPTATSDGAGAILAGTW